jgi:LysM repeat protein
MTETAPAGPGEPRGSPSRPTPQPSIAAGLCPYLATSAGWRRATPAREHLCTAVDPPSPLAIAKQRRLCLTAGHSGCATFVAATEARQESASRRLRPIARTTVLVLDPARPRLAWSAGWTRRSGQAGLAMLMIGAVVAIVVSRSGGPNPAGSGPAPSAPSTSAAVGAVTSTPPASLPPPGVRTATASPSAAAATPAPSASGQDGSPGPGPTALPSPTRTYTVRPGDTLSAIAARFGTTVRIIQQLNGIANPSLIRVGQVLAIP